MSTFSQTVFQNKYAHRKDDGTLESWDDLAHRVTKHVVEPYRPHRVKVIRELIEEKKFLPGGRYLYATGKRFHQTQNCLLLTVDDSRESWADLMRRITAGLMTGAGIGVVYSALRENGAPVRGMGGQSTGPLALMQMVNEAGRHVMQGGSRRSAMWAGLHWNHPDIYDFIEMKNWPQWLRDQKETDFNTPAPMDMTNISVILDDEFFDAFHDARHPAHVLAKEVFFSATERMLKTGEPGFSVDVGENRGENLRNACTEVTSADDNDICNLGSLNMANFNTLGEFEDAVWDATEFLVCGTLYSKVPYPEVEDTRNKNRRLGLGLMGIHEWLLLRGYRYEANEELERWLKVYEETSNAAARVTALHLDISTPIKTRAIAPTGTISIIAETTSGIEPVFCKAFKRRYLKGSSWHYQYVIDATAKRIVDQGVDPAMIEDAYDLSRDVRRRLDFQAEVQQYVDHGISSTINLPANCHKDEAFKAEFRSALIAYLPHLRGVTVYPDGARGGQPLTKVSMEEALAHEGTEYEEYGNEHACVGGACGL